jgi:hypothetical protein
MLLEEQAHRALFEELVAVAGGGVRELTLAA